ncbi:MAG: hypothetical protein ABH831_00115 [Candidatus Nealsonbacteria bacterium]
MKKIYIVLIILIVIASISLIRNWQSDSWQGIYNNSSTNLQPIEPESNSGFSLVKTTGDYQEFTAADGDFKIKYPGSWISIENEGLLKASVPAEWQEKYSFSTLLLSQQFINERFVQLIISHGVFDISTQEIIDKMEEANLAQNWTTEIVESNIGGKSNTFQIRYLVPGSPNLYSKELILNAGGNNVYLVAFVTYEKDWTSFSEQANFILDSAQIVE